MRIDRSFKHYTDGPSVYLTFFMQITFLAALAYSGGVGGGATCRQALLGALFQLLDQAFLTQRFAFARALLGIHQRHRRAGEEKTRPLTALVLGKPAQRIVADAAIQRTIGGAHQIDKPGFWLKSIHKLIRLTQGSAQSINARSEIPSGLYWPARARRFSPAASTPATGPWHPRPGATNATGQNGRDARRSCRRETRTAPGYR